VKPRRYLILALGLATALTGGIVAVNAYVDPYGIAAATGIDDYQGAASVEPSGAFWRKAAAVKTVRPRTVILGTSRAEVIDRNHSGFAAEDAPVLNLSLGGVNIEQMRLLLMHAHATSPVRAAVIGLDLEAFQGGGRPDVDPAGLRGNPDSEPELLVWLRVNLSRAALSASLARWIIPAPAAPGPETGSARSPGATNVPVDRLFGQRGLIWITEFNNFYARLPYLLPYWTPDTTWASDERRAKSMAEFRKLLDYARKERIELRIFISPVHARYLEWYRRVGWSPLFQAWKRALVTTIDEESRETPGRAAFPLWDFGGYHPPALEPVPKAGDLSTRMHWYLETSHYSRALGDLILDRVLGRPGSGESPLPDTRIDRATIERHLSTMTLEADRHRLTAPDEVADVGDSYARLRRAIRK